MSCALTIEAVRARTKTVTRRHIASWSSLRPGDQLVLVERVRGLRRGDRHVVLARVEVIAVSVEPLDAIDQADVDAEGFPGLTPVAFVEQWLASAPRPRGTADQLVRRIVWRYVDDVADSRRRRLLSRAQ